VPDVSGNQPSALAHSISRISRLVASHPNVLGVRLVGSRAEGRATELSDVDLLVETDDFDRVAADLPQLLEPLHPLAQQWDRLSEEATYYMVMLPEAVKLDLVFDRPPTLEPPWEVRADTLAGLDAHFWDWILWLGGKEPAGNHELVGAMLGGRMLDHLLRPVCVSSPPRPLAEAVAGYLAARAAREAELETAVDRSLGSAVLARLVSAGLVRRA